jgi:hypothetical protein
LVRSAAHRDWLPGLAWLSHPYRGQHDLLAGASPAARAKIAPWVGGWTIVVAQLCAGWGIGALSFRNAVSLSLIVAGLLFLIIVTMFGGSTRRSK